MDASADREALDRFGELLVRRVRAKSIADWDKILGGLMKGATADRLRPELDRLPDDARTLVGRLVPEIVDTALHHLLWTLEQEEDVNVSVETSRGSVSSLREASDGLSGELYDWIPRFGEAKA